MIWLIFVTAALCAETRPSNLSARHTQGPDDYLAYALDGVVGLNEDWSAQLSAFRSDSGVAELGDEELVSQELRLGADWQVSPTWGAAFQFISRRDPYELNARGVALAARSVVSDWWQGKRDTTVRLRFEQLSYTQDLSVEGRLRTLEVQRNVQQRAGTVALEHELLDWLSASLSHTRYNYSEESSQLALSTSRRRAAWAGSSGISYGMPDRSSTLELVLTPLTWAEARISTNRSRVIDEETETKTHVLGLSFFWKDFELELEAAQTDYGDLSGDEEEKQTFVTAGLGYGW